MKHNRKIISVGDFGQEFQLVEINPGEWWYENGHLEDPTEVDQEGGDTPYAVEDNEETEGALVLDGEDY